jgi:hypothetical protein
MNIELLIIIILLVYIFTNFSFKREKYENYSPFITKKENKINNITDVILNNDISNIVNTLNNDNFDIYIIHMTKNAIRLDNFDKYYLIQYMVLQSQF